MKLVRRYVLCWKCFAVMVPAFGDGTYGPCDECGSLKTAHAIGRVTSATE